MSELTGDAVEAVLVDCLYTEAEIEEAGKTPPDGCTVFEGIASSYGLHPGRLEAHREEVVGWIGQLQPQFLEGEGGGGWSFLNLCERADGVLWTGLHMRCEQLVALAHGLGLGEYLLPREIWSSFPGGVPYVVFRREAKS